MFSFSRIATYLRDIGTFFCFRLASTNPSCGVCMRKLTRSRARAFALTRAYRDKFSCANSENPKHNVDCRRDSPHCTQQWLRRGPGCITVHNETYQNQLSKPPTPSISDDSKTPVGSDFLSSCGFEREEKIQQKSSVNSSAILFSPIP